MNKKILLIEDDMEDVLIIRRIVEEYINNHGDEHISFESYFRVQDLMHEMAQHADHSLLMLVDLSMPIESGFDVLIRLSTESMFKYAPKLVISHSTDVITIKKAIEAGADAFLPKQIQYDDFRHRIHTAIDFYFNCTISV